MADVVLGANVVVVAFPDGQDSGSTIFVAAAIGVACVACQVTHTRSKGILVDACVDGDSLSVNQGGIDGNFSTRESEAGLSEEQYH